VALDLLCGIANDSDAELDVISLLFVRVCSRKAQMSTRTNINLNNKFILASFPNARISFQHHSSMLLATSRADRENALRKPWEEVACSESTFSEGLIHAETYREREKTDADARYAATQPERAARHCVVEKRFRRLHSSDGGDELCAISHYW
jgi:hypothetical protein